MSHPQGGETICIRPLGSAALLDKELELLNAAANVTSQDDLDALRLTLLLFFAEQSRTQ